MRRSHHPQSKSARPWATRLAALLAVFLQAFVLQTHVHAAAPLSAAGYERTADDGSAVAESATEHETLAACALCQAQSAGRSLAPSSVDVLPVNRGDSFEAAPEIRHVSVAAAHSWQSRAPPAHL